MTNGTLHPIRARSPLLQLLGEELISDDCLAIFELVKNGYDADANEVEISVNLAARSERSIVVQDSGTGMTLDLAKLGGLYHAVDFRQSRHERSRELQR